MARWSFKTLTPLVMLVGAACATGAQQPQQQQPFAANGQEVLTAGYQQIAERYIRAVPTRDVALNAMKGLTALDPNFGVRETDGVIGLTFAGKPAGRVPMPPDNQPEQWAMASVSVVQLAKTASPKIKAADSEAIYSAMFGSTLRKLDRFSRYTSAADTRDRRAIRDGYGGIGITIQTIKGVTKVVSVMPATPAAKAGLKNEDSIIAIDGNTIAGQDLRAVVRQLRGPAGSRVRLTVVRQNLAKPLDVSVERKRIVPNLVLYKRDGKIAVIKIYRFNHSTTRNVARAIIRAQAEIGPSLSGYVLDLRSNPGGLLTQSIRVSDLFVSSGPIVSTRGRHPYSFQEYFARSGDLTLGKPVVVLVNGRSASASEIVAAALQDSGRAVIVGSTTFGKGTVQTVTPLPNEGELILTWSRFHAPTGYSLHQLGVMPNICTSRGINNAADALRKWRQGYGKTTTLFRTWRRHAAPGQANENALRANCPPAVRTAGPDIDMSVARELLRQPSLYSRALRQNRPNFAGHAAEPTGYAADPRR